MSMDTSTMKPALKAKVDPLLQRWEGFKGKIAERVEAVRAEADAGLDQLIAQHATDHGPMGAAFSQLQARFNGLTTKLDEAYESFEEKLDEAADDIEDDLDANDWDQLSGLQSALHADKTALYDKIELTYEHLQMEKNAEWARRLRALAEQEIAAGAKCSSCGAPTPVETPWTATQVKCSSCGALNDVQPGMAAGLFYQGLGAHALAQEASWDLWVAERAAKTAFDARRCPTAYDHWLYLDTARKYYTAYYEAGLKVYPAFTQDVGAAVEAKMKHYTAWDQPVDQQAREFYGQLVDCANKGDAEGMKRLVASKPHHVDFDDCGYALVERNLIDAAKFLYGLQYAAEGETDPQAMYVAEKLKDARSTLR